MIHTFQYRVYASEWLIQQLSFPSLWRNIFGFLEPGYTLSLKVLHVGLLRKIVLHVGLDVFHNLIMQIDYRVFNVFLLYIMLITAFRDCSFQCSICQILRWFLAVIWLLLFFFLENFLGFHVSFLIFHDFSMNLVNFITVISRVAEIVWIRGRNPKDP